MKRYMNETEKYEIWKKKFRKEIQEQLSDIFSKKVAGCFVSVYCVDKWNVYFNIRGLASDITKLENDVSLQQILNIKSLWDEPTGCICELHAKTKDEFDTKFGYLRIAVI